MSDNVILAANISFSDDIVNAVVTLPGPVDGLPATNLINRDRYKICRVIPSGGEIDIYVVLEESQSVGAIGVFGLNLSSAATAQCRLISGSSEIWDSGVASIYPSGAGFTLPKMNRSLIWWADENYTIDQIWITLTDTEDYFDISRIAFGAKWSPEFNPEYEGVQWSWRNTAEYYRTQGSTGRASPRDAYRRVRWQMQHLSELQRNQLALYLQQAGQSMMISQHPGIGGQLEYENQMLCHLVDTQDLIPVYASAWATALTFEEV